MPLVVPFSTALGSMRAMAAPARSVAQTIPRPSDCTANGPWRTAALAGWGPVAGSARAPGRADLGTEAAGHRELGDRRRGEVRARRDARDLVAARERHPEGAGRVEGLVHGQGRAV